MSKILCFGSAGKDIFFPTSEGKTSDTPEDILSQKKIAFELGAKYRIKERQETLGGCAANVAVGMAKLDSISFCVSSIGKDVDGIWVREELKKRNVNIDLMTIDQDLKSDMSAIIVDTSSADRVIFTSRTSSGNISIDKEKAEEADWFFIGDVHGEWKKNLENIVELAKEENKKIVFNPREAGIHEDAAEITEVLGLAELVFLNKDEAIEIISKMTKGEASESINDEKFLLKKLASLEMKVVVLTDGERGAWASDGEKTFFAEALKTSAVDATGAGDSFLSGFLSAYIKEKSLEECLQWGIANSSSVVEHYGAIKGLLDEKAILEKTENIKVKNITENTK
jgi:sugar/nucleoside kinase (ribokinase family)